MFVLAASRCPDLEQFLMFDHEPAAVSSDHMTRGGGRTSGPVNIAPPSNVTQKPCEALHCEEAVGGSGGSAAQLILGFRR